MIATALGGAFNIAGGIFGAHRLADLGHYWFLAPVAATQVTVAIGNAVNLSHWPQISQRHTKHPTAFNGTLISSSYPGHLAHRLCW